MTLMAIAWDVDGTLVDSEPLHHRALLASCRHFGLDLSHLPEERFCGVHIFDVWEQLKPELPPEVQKEEWLQAIEEYYHQHSNELIAIPGSQEVIRQLAAQGIKQACVSNSCRRIVESNLQALGVLEFIDIIVTLDDVLCGKPDPEPYQQAINFLDLPASAVLAVEDSPTGMLSARAAGMPVVFYGALPSPIAQVSEITSLAQILQWF